MAHFRCGLGLAGQRALQAGLQARLARLCRSHRSSSDRRTTGVSPHRTTTCTDIGGRVTDGAVSSVAVEWSDRARTVAPWLFKRHRAGAVACTSLGGFGHCECPGVRVRERREEAKGRARRHGDIAFAHRARNDPCDQCGQGGLVFLALAGPAVRWLGDSAPRSEVARRLTGPVASGRGPGCGFVSDCAIPPPSQAGVGFGLWLGSPDWFGRDSCRTK